MIYQCNQCEFTSFNEKALQQHIKEKHIVKVDPVVDPVPVVDKPEKKENKSHGAGEYTNFYIELKGKPVTCEFVNGKVISGTLAALNQYEIKIKTKEEMVIVFKHSLATLKVSQV